MLAQLGATGLAAPLETLPGDLTIAEALALYLEHAKTYYGKDGKPGSQCGRIRAVALCTMDLFGSELARDFGPLKLRTVQAELIARGYTRRNINQMIGVLRLSFKWLASHELVPAATALALGVVAGLRAGKTEAKESEAVRPVPDGDIEAVLAVLPATVKAMVSLQLACGARPGEIFEIRPCDIDRSATVWSATLGDHKTAHCGKSRTLFFGPKAQAILRPFLLNRGPADYIFNPREAIAQRNEKAHTHRRPGQPESPRKTVRVLGDRYDTSAYRRAVARACVKAKVPTWHPHQLRHNAATEIRKQFGIEGAQVILGHSNISVTEVYAETDREKALSIAAALG